MRIAAVMFGLAGCIFAQDRTVLEGVYTAAQAMRGEAQYQMHCARCHGDDLSGRAMGPLKGDKFLDRWREDNLGILFEHIRTKMPASEPGSLSEGAYLDILAHILQQNSIPPGEKELTAAAVAAVKLVGKDGSKPLSTNSLVQVTGCLALEGADNWILIDATDPVRSRNPEKSTPEELKNAAGAPAGSARFRLQNLEDLQPPFNATNSKGQKVQVKGVLIRQTNRDRINVLRADSVAAACGK
jgi:mono/diheme cytochrome c family protein